MIDCECSDEYGPCEQHADILVIREGASLHSADELALLLVSDLIDCGVKLSEDDQQEYDRLSAVIERDSTSGVASFPEVEGYSDSEAAFELAERVETYADGLWITHDDGYVIARPHDDCPLLQEGMRGMVDPFELSLIPLDHLFIDFSYHQRPPARFLERISGDFDPMLIVSLVVNRRDDYQPDMSPWRRVLHRLMFWRRHPWYSIIDGATRYEAARIVHERELRAKPWFVRLWLAVRPYDPTDRSGLPCLVRHLTVDEEAKEFVRFNSSVTRP